MWKIFPAALLMTSALLPALTAADSPKLAVPSPKTDLGEFPANKEREAVFKLANQGAGTLKVLNISKVCGCLEASASSMDIAPGGTAEIKARILANSVQGAFAKNFHVSTNDPRNPITTLTVSGTAKPVAKVAPKDIIYAGQLKTGAAWEQVLTLEPTEPGVELGQPLVESTYPARADLKPLPDGKYELKLTADLDKAKGDLRITASVPVLKPAGWKPVEALVAAKVGAEFVSIPGKMFAPPQADSGFTAKFQLKLAGAAPTPEKVAWRPDLPGVVFKFQPPDERGAMAATAEFTPDALKRIATEEVVVFTFEHPGASVAELMVVSNK